MSQSTVFGVVLAGGSGTRFWPASRRLRPKQLLPIGPCAPLSLIKSTVSRLDGLVSNENVLVLTGRHLLDGTRAELADLSSENFLAEPCAKNTAPCIGWAAWVAARKDADAILCVLPSDQHASDEAGFRETLKRAIAEAERGTITTVGVVPTRPETGYGYIKKGEARGPGAFKVGAFVEKPDETTALSYLQSGDYLWNAGMFIFRAKDMIAAFRKHLPAMAAALDQADEAAKSGPDEEGAAIERFFDEAEGVSIDYGVMEKERDLTVVPGDFGWSDLGSWESAWELSPKDADDNSAPAGSVLVDARRNLVADLRSQSSAPPKKVIALVGVEDLCVIETDDALLVMPRSRSQDVRAVVDALKARGDVELV